MFINLACLSGYFGRNCSSQCQYPNYGQQCQNMCDCNVTECNHVTGCQRDRTKKETTTGLNINFIICLENNKNLSTILRE